MLLAADYMGLPYGGDHGTDLLWIADAFLCPQLPFGWAATSKAGWLEPGWLSGGFFQRQIMPQAAPSFGQPRPISHLSDGRL